MIYLDNAATSYPKPESVINAALYAMRDAGGNSGRGSHKSAIKAGELVYNVREKAAELFGCESERVIFTLNCTMSLNMAIKGSVKKGDHVIISSLEHNSVLRPVHRLSEEGIITYSVARVNPLSDDETLKNFASLIKKETSLIISSAVSNVFGTILPVSRLGGLCRKRKIRFIVDGAQAAGMREINMKQSNIDILCLPGHKGLMGIMGTGLLLFSENTDIEPLIQGGTGSFSLIKTQPEIYPDRLESGTLNLPGIVSVGEGIDFIKREGGTSAVYQKEKSLTDMLFGELANVRNTVLYPMFSGKNASGIVSFNIKGQHSEKVGQMLSDAGFAVRAGYHCSYLAHKVYGTDKTGVVRISPGYFTTKKELKSLIFYLNKIAMGKIL
ncbi:MAG: aminotransferase class V-fold PLP-dependent enzyme [Clostridia bacterium]|nr:aminotransferase class V-fold PLP-dependent enzyme [Clostridia bacterium]